MTRILVLDRSEELAEQTRSVVSDLPTPPEVVSCTRIGSVGHVQEHDGPFSILIAGPSLATRAGLRRLATLRREVPGTEIIMSFASRPEASLREIIQVGALDLLEAPPDDMSLRAAIRRALDIAERAPRASSASSPMVQPQAVPARQGRVFTVCSATGGCGKTFYATNMASFLAQHANASVVLVDLDLQFGEVTTALRLQPSYTIADVLKRDEGGSEDVDLGSHISDYLVQYADRFWALPAPKEPAQADRITPVEVTKVLEALRARFDYVVVDTPTALAETVLAAFDVSEHLFALATLDLPSVRNLGVFLQTLGKLRVPVDNVSLVLNKVEKDVGIDVDQIVRLFPQGFRSTLPYAREVSKSVNLGKPIITSFPDTKVSKELVAGLREFLPEDARARMDAAPAPAASGLFGRLFRRLAPQPHGGMIR